MDTVFLFYDTNVLKITVYTWGGAYWVANIENSKIIYYDKQHNIDMIIRVRIGHLLCVFAVFRRVTVTVISSSLWVSSFFSVLSKRQTSRRLSPRHPTRVCAVWIEFYFLKIILCGYNSWLWRNYNNVLVGQLLLSLCARCTDWRVR